MTLVRPIAPDVNAHIARALDDLPGYTDALEVAAHAQRLLDELAQVPDVDAKLDPLAGGNMSKWLEASLRHSAAIAEHDARHRLLTDLRRRAEDRAGGIIRANVDDILAGLHRHLMRLLAEAASVAEELDGAATAEEAIARDVGPAWKRLGALAAEYAELRAAQRLLMVRFDPGRMQSARPSGRGDDHASDLYFSNMDDVWPDWRVPRHTTFRVDGTVERLEPWPDDPTAFLLWCVAADGRAWIPTRQELDALWEQRRRTANPNPQITVVGEALNEPLPGDRRIAPTARNVASTESVLT